MIIAHRNCRSYDEVMAMTKLRRICDDFMIMIFFEWPLMLFLLANFLGVYRIVVLDYSAEYE